MVNFLRTQIMKKSESCLTASLCFILRTLCCKMSKFNPYRRKISRQVTPAMLILNAIDARFDEETAMPMSTVPCRDNAPVFTRTSGRGSLTLSRFRGTNFGTLSDFVRLLSKKDGSLEEQKFKTRFLDL